MSEQPPLVTAGNVEARGRVGRRVPAEGLPTLPLPKISPLLVHLFTRYVRGYVRRHFHSVRVAIAGCSEWPKDRPVVLYANHPSWWDPLVGLFLREKIAPDRRLYAPIEAAALARYGIFRRLGFFGVEKGTARGARQFLRQSARILERPESLLALTPQGRFADIRERPVRFASGLGHLVRHAPHACYIPLALEYVLWEERLPEILVRFGRPIVPGASTRIWPGPDDWTLTFERELERTMDALAVQAQSRARDEFRVLQQGRAGQGGVYDWWQALRARARGQRFQPEHRV